MEKKGSYDQAKSSMDGELSRVAGEVKQLESDVQEAEQSYHELNMKMSTADSKLARARKETSCVRKEGGMRYSPEYQTLSEHYQKQIQLLDEQCKDLRKEQKVVKDTHEDNLKQKKAFMQLERLMQVKLKVAQQELQNLQFGGLPGGLPTRTVMDASTIGVERLVIE